MPNHNTSTADEQFSSTLSRPSGTRVAIQAALAFAASMGVARFVFTPIIPLMEAQAGITPQESGILANANNFGYLVGAVAGIVMPAIGRTRLSLRVSGIALTLSIFAMPLWVSMPICVSARAIAGVAIAIVFMVAANWMLDKLSQSKSHLIGWAYGGIGGGIAASGLLVSVAGTFGDWKSAWYLSGIVVAILVLCSWNVGTVQSQIEVATSNLPTKKSGPWFTLLTVSYFFQGAGYIVAGTFLVAAVASSGPEWLGNGVWTVVGITSIPSCAFWAWLSSRYSKPALMAVAMTLQAIGIALPAFSTSTTAAILSAILFGSTFVGVVTLALGTGRELGVLRATAVLTTVNSIGQVIGVLVVTPLLADGYRNSLYVGSLFVLIAALCSALMRIRFPGIKQSKA